MKLVMVHMCQITQAAQTGRCEFISCKTQWDKKKEKGRETDREREKKRRLDMQPVSKEEKKSAFKNKTKKIKQIFL